MPDISIFVIGGMAGALSHVSAAPIDRYIILKQLNDKDYRKLNIHQYFKLMYTKEGIAGFFKGSLINLFRVSYFAGLEFFFYELFKATLYHNTPKADMTLDQKLVSGALTGVVASTLTYPLDLLRTYAALDHGTKHRYMTVMAFKIVRTDGLQGLYRGWAVSMAGIIPLVGIKMSSFDWMLHNLMAKPIDKRSYNYMAHCVAFGSISGCISVSLVYPLNVLRHKLQLNHHHSDHNYSNFKDAFRQTYQTNGIRGFYIGLTASLAKMTPMTGLLFLSNELMKFEFKQI